MLKSTEIKSIEGTWLSIIAQYLIPVLSQVKENTGLAHELFSLIQIFPYETRFALYGEWKHKTYDSMPELMYEKAACTRDTRYIMR